MSSSEQFIEDLHAELTAASARLAARRKRNPTRLLALAVAASLIVVAGVVGLTLTSSVDVDADVEVIRQGDQLIIRLTDVETRPEEIEAAAREAGVDVRVVEVPVGPSNVGRFVGSSSTQLVPDLRLVEGDRTSPFNGYSVPADYQGTIELRLGRERRDGEDWVALSSATSRGEPLECETVFARPLGEVRELIERKGFTDVRYSVLSLAGMDELTPAELGQHADALVLGVMNLDSDSLLVDAVTSLDVVAPDTGPYPSYGCPEEPGG